MNPQLRISSLLCHGLVAGLTLIFARGLHQGTGCLAQESGRPAIQADVARAVELIRKGGKEIEAGFEILNKVDFGGTFPDQLLALVHSPGDGADEIMRRMGDLITWRKPAISGRRLAAEYDKAGKTGRRVRQVLCAFAAYQTGREPPYSRLGLKPDLPQPRPLDEETLALLARALTDDDLGVRVAAADSIRLAGIREQRFRELLLKAIRDENTVVSQAASLAAAELEFTEAGPVILQRLETHLKDPAADSRGDLEACGLPLAPGDRLRLWGDYFSPWYGVRRWIPALGMLRYRPALFVLRQMAGPHAQPPTEEEKDLLTGGEGKFGCEEDFALAIIEIEHGSFRPVAALQLAEDATLAGDVRAAALRRFDEREQSYVNQAQDPATGFPPLTDAWQQYYQPEILRRVIKLIGDRCPIRHRGEPSRLGRLAVEVSARMLSVNSYFYAAQSHARGQTRILNPNEHNKPPLRFTNVTLPENLLPVQRQLREKLESLLPGEDGALALEALAFACEWGTIEKYVGVAINREQPPLLRVAAANLLLERPFLLELKDVVNPRGLNAPPKTAGRLLPLLEIRQDAEDGRFQEAVTNVFQGLLGTPRDNLSGQQRAARRELLPKLRALRNSPQADNALNVLRAVYGFSRAEIAWDSNSADHAEELRATEETGAGAYAGPPAEVTAEHSCPFQIRFLTLAEKGQTLLVGEGYFSSDRSSRVLLLNPPDLTEKAKTSITGDLPWSSSTAVLGRDQRHVLVFNRVFELPAWKTVCVLDIKKAVAKGNVNPHPLAVSPDGKLGLVHVASFIGPEHDALALFELASGKLQRTIDVAEEQPVWNACFLTDHMIAIQGCRGCVLAVDLANGRQRVLCDNGPRSFSLCGTNWHMAVVADSRYLVVSGREEFLVIDIHTGKPVLRRTTEGGNALPILGGRFLLYQGRAGPLGSPLVFSCARVPDGKVVATFGRHGPYDTLMAGEQDDVIYAVSHDTLRRLRFRLGGGMLTADPKAKADSVRND